MTAVFLAPSLAVMAAGMTFGTVINGYLSRTVGLFGSVCVYLVVGSVLALVTLPLTGGFQRIVAGIAGASFVLALPGLINIFMIASQLKVVTEAGAGTLTSGLFVGQVTTGLLLDRFGAFGQPMIALSTTRMVGGGLAIAGLLLFNAAMRGRRTA